MAEQQTPRGASLATGWINADRGLDMPALVGWRVEVWDVMTTPGRIMALCLWPPEPAPCYDTWGGGKRWYLVCHGWTRANVPPFWTVGAFRRVPRGLEAFSLEDAANDVRIDCGSARILDARGAAAWLGPGHLLRLHEGGEFVWPPRRPKAPGRRKREP